MVRQSVVLSVILLALFGALAEPPPASADCLWTTDPKVTGYAWLDANYGYAYDESEEVTPCTPAPDTRVPNDQCSPPCPSPPGMVLIGNDWAFAPNSLPPPREVKFTYLDHDVSAARQQLVLEVLPTLQRVVTDEKSVDSLARLVAALAFDPPASGHDFVALINGAALHRQALTKDETDALDYLVATNRIAEITKLDQLGSELDRALARLRSSTRFADIPELIATDKKTRTTFSTAFYLYIANRSDRVFHAGQLETVARRLTSAEIAKWFPDQQ
jgi:hypothetical protein